MKDLEEEFPGEEEDFKKHKTITEDSNHENKSQSPSKKSYSQTKTNHLNIQITRIDKENKEEYLTIDSSMPLTKKEITQIVIEKTSNHDSISEIKVKYNNSKEGDIIIKFNNKSEDTNNLNLKNSQSSNSSTKEGKKKYEAGANGSKNEKNDRIDRSVKSSNNSVERKTDKEINKEPLKLIQKESSPSKEKHKKKSKKLKMYDDDKVNTNQVNINGKLINSNNSDAVVIGKKAARYDNFGNIIMKNGNHKICFADTSNKPLIETIDIQSHKEFIANLNKMDDKYEEKARCKCSNCFVFW